MGESRAGFRSRFVLRIRSAWTSIKGMRNILVHEYERWSGPVVWETLTVSVPALLQQIGPCSPTYRRTSLAKRMIRL